MKHWKRTFAGAALAAACALPLSAQELVKVGTFVPEQSVGVSQVIKPWMEAVSAAAGDEVRMQGFWGGTLGKSPFKQFELVQNGVADVTWVLPGYTAGQFPEMGVFELPFLFRTAEEASVVGWQMHEMGLLTGFDGVHVVGFFAAEPNALFMKKKIGSLDDLANMKIRSVGGIHASWLEALGAAPQTLSSAEMNEGLNRGTVDGAIQGWTGMRTFKSLPLVDQAYVVPAGAIPFLLLMNEDKWNSLSEAAQAAIMEHGGRAMAQAGGGAYSDIGNAIRDDVIAEGRIEIVTPDDATIDAYAEQAKVVHEAWIAETPNGQAVYDAAVTLLAEMRGAS
ncbi:TRAP transporter substrate-binding protein [Aestuariivita sp.]|jgi:TRAP-type C4-dicarboxylate transport system substrate-binding protein|uniref:TRAP transporter substrate-binding protein n=1 Tax=Aestuariivita sp. TaxID=1872407 RepID=UPI00216F04DA|nr:TRAP transporter substrate-binding protein [Aestuariivita sp.]MCE8009168.1 TRAP transporter substrate-binding protein [Aestuariivita sp.]